MLVNLSEVMATEGKVVNSEFPLEMEKIPIGLDAFPVFEKKPVILVFSNIGQGQVRVEGSCRLTVIAVCDRCLTDVPVTLELAIDRNFVSPETAAEDEDAEDNRSMMDGYQLDVEALVYDEIVVNWPMKILCREDCKGVCPVCGRNRNERECGCDTFVPDPRMAAINDIFNANKEV